MAAVVLLQKKVSLRFPVDSGNQKFVDIIDKLFDWTITRTTESQSLSKISYILLLYKSCMKFDMVSSHTGVYALDSADNARQTFIITAMKHLVWSVLDKDASVKICHQ